MGGRGIVVLEGGLQTTVQDWPGRRGMQAKGFFPAGAMDHFAHRAANLLVGNDASAATLEVTLGNVAFRLESDATVAVCGAEAEMTLDGKAVHVWESRRAPAGAELRIGIAPGPGFRLYVAFSGGVDVPV
ncbi:MAG: urea amidolyase, partial [Actinobacteria bacterium]|nr:urea amidolyase [Actinomycetota bacterium]